TSPATPSTPKPSGCCSMLKKWPAAGTAPMLRPAAHRKDERLRKPAGRVVGTHHRVASHSAARGPQHHRRAALRAVFRFTGDLSSFAFLLALHADASVGKNLQPLGRNQLAADFTLRGARP